MKRCSGCGAEKALSDFYRDQSKRLGVCSRCKSCALAGVRQYKARNPDYQRSNNIERRVSNRDRARVIKMERGCADCGYREHPDALDFDHLPQFQKHTANTHAAFLATWAWPRIAEEIAKCEVVCANCHRIRTAERRNLAA